MARKRRPKNIPLRIGNDSSLWKFESLQAALPDSVDVLSQLIRSVEDDMVEKEAVADEVPVPSNNEKFKEA